MGDDITVMKVPPLAAAGRRARHESGKRLGRIGPYQVFEQIASGGMGEVYSGQHRYLGRRVAIKVLHQHLERDTSVLDRFHTEAQATARIRHPGIVHVYDYGFDRKGRTFLVTELLEGQTLAQRMSAGPLPIPLVIEIARQLTSALSAVHRSGIVHRDVKPENVYLASDACAHSGLRVKVLDFGLSKLAARAPGHDGTQAGTIVGTPLYMAPEQWRCDAVDHRADIYAVGCLLYEMACGVLPFTGRRMTDLCDSHCGQTPRPPREINARIPIWLERLILKMTAKRAEHRPPSMLDVERELRGPDPGDVQAVFAEGSSPGLELLSTATRSPRRKSRLRSALFWFLCAAAAGIGLGALISPWLT